MHPEAAKNIMGKCLWYGWRSHLGIVAITSGVLFFGNCAIAQTPPSTVPDDTLGAESSIVTPNVEINGVPSDRIDGGATRGTNLFHSFQELNVGEGRGAYFSNPTGIENIFSRVTGTNRSEIMGRLGVLGDANLFLLNPNGIMFGPNASLDLRGSFLGSTANSIKFSDGTEFRANASQIAPILTNGDTSFANASTIFSSVEPGGIGNGGKINITAKTLSFTDGAGVAVNSQGSGKGGNIQIQAGTLKLDNKAFISGETVSNQGGDINLSINDLLLLRRNSKISTSAGTAQTGGDGGNITINTPNGFIVAFPKENSDIAANAFEGSGGRVDITAFNLFNIQPLSGSNTTSSICRCRSFFNCGSYFLFLLVK